MLRFFNVAFYPRRYGSKSPFTFYPVLGKMVLSGRNKNCECASFPQAAAYIDGPAMQLGQFVNQSQANARALMSPAAGALYTMKPLENPRQLVLRNSRAGIRYGKFDPIFRGPESDFDFSVKGELERIGQEIQYDLFPHVTVHIHRKGKRGAIHFEFKAGFFHG